MPLLCRLGWHNRTGPKWVTAKTDVSRGVFPFWIECVRCHDHGEGTHRLIARLGPLSQYDYRIEEPRR